MADAPKKRKRVTIRTLNKKMREGEQIVQMAIYDYRSAVIADRQDIDILCVSDTGGMILFGHKSTVTVTFDEVMMMAKAIDRGSQYGMRMVDMPYWSFHVSAEQAVENAGRFVHEANAEVMKMLETIGEDADDDRVVATVRGMLARKQRVPGFGHRVYSTEDPRATHLRQMSRDLGRQANNTRWFEISQRIEAVMTAEKQIDANVDFYSATVYYSLGIPTDLFTPIFAIARTSGWTAHVLEQLADNRLIRPRGVYDGPDDLKFKPISER